MFRLPQGDQGVAPQKAAVPGVVLVENREKVFPPQGPREFDPVVQPFEPVAPESLLHLDVVEAAVEVLLPLGGKDPVQVENEAVELPLELDEVRLHRLFDGGNRSLLQNPSDHGGDRLGGLTVEQPSRALLKSLPPLPVPVEQIDEAEELPLLQVLFPGQRVPPLEENLGAVLFADGNGVQLLMVSRQSPLGNEDRGPPKGGDLR